MHDKNRDDLFAGTPPLFAMRVLLSSVASQPRGKRDAVMILDVKRAFFYGDMKRDFFIELRQEDQRRKKGSNRK